MSNPNNVDAALALWRFGLGAADGGITAIKNAPRDLLKEEIAEHAVPIPVGAQLRSSSDLLVALYAYQQQVKAEREPTAAPAAHPVATSQSMTGANTVQGGQPSTMQAGPMLPQQQSMQVDKKPDTPVSKRPYFPQQILLAEADARFNGTIHEPLIGFGERLAMFWTNHFSVAISKNGEVHILAGAFEREAIRPHIFGRFEDMLLAVETHPAMLIFLDNQQSIGPTSAANNNGKRGLNENLAREIMELHTLGVDGGYTQEDVTSLARIITGWTFYRDEKRPGPQGKFMFNASAHEPGDHTVMGMTYAGGNVEQGRNALRDLARNPATAKHIATKLARHFVADQPSPALVKKLAAAYTKTQGDLSAVYTALVDAEEAWNPTLAKMRTPLEYVTAMLRTSGIKPKPEQVLSMLNALGQPLWNPAGPNGFSDVTDAWASSEALATRIDAANLMAHQFQGQVDPRVFVGDRLGPLLTADTLQAISRAETRPQGLSLAFLSPEFQRR